MNEVLELMKYDEFDKDIFSCLLSKGKIDLTDEQIDAVNRVVKENKCILTFEMGLGKTSIMMSVGMLLLPKAIQENKLIIISAPQASISSFKEIIESQCYFQDKIMVIDGQRKNVDKFLDKLDNNEVNLLICQHSCWQNSPIFNFEIFNRRHRVMATIYDESVEKKSKGYAHFVALSELQSEYVIMATASFSGSVSSFKGNNPEVLLPLYNIFKAVSLLPNTTYNTFLRNYTTTEFKRNVTHYKPNLDKIMELAKDKIINMSRAHINLETEFEHIEFLRAEPTMEMENYIVNTSDSYRRILYGEVKYINYTVSAIPSLAKVVQLLPTLSPETNKLIYCNNRETTQKMKDLLEVLGYRVFIINGQVTPKDEDKKLIENKFNETKGSVMITNIIKCINLPSVKDIISLSIPNDLPQFISRSTRGYVKGKVNLYVIYYPKYELETIESCYKMINVTDKTLDRSYKKLLNSFETEINENRGVGVFKCSKIL